MLRLLLIVLACAETLAQDNATNKTDADSAATLTGVTANGPGDLKAFIAALILNSIIVLGCLIGFTFLRLTFPMVYSHEKARSKESLSVAGEDSSDSSTSRCREIRSRMADWLSYSISTSTETAMERAGLDAALLRDFCTLGATICAVIGIPMCIVIVPINSVLGGADEGDDHLSLAEMATIRENHPWLFYVHAVVVWLVCIIVHFVLTRAQARFLRLRVKWLTRMPAPRCTTVLVENIPCAWRSDARLREFFGKIFSPEDVLSCHMVKREEEIAKLVSKRETLQQMKRKAELTYEKTQQVEMFRPSFCGKKEWNVSAAPVSRDIRWNDLRKSRNLSKGSEIIGFLAVLGLYVGFMPIVIFITNIAKLVHLGPLQPIWQGFAPTLGLLLFLSLLPTVLMIIFRTFFSLKDWETKKPDLGGVFWATQIGYIQLALALYCIFMVGVLQAKSASHAWVVAAPSLLFVLWSFVHIRRAYRWEKLPFQEVAFQCEETDISSTENKSRVMAPVLMAEKLFSVVGPLVGGKLLESYGVHQAMMKVAAATSMLALINQWMLKETKPTDIGHVPKKTESALKRYKELLQDARIREAVIFSAFYWGIFASVLYCIVPLMLAQVFGYGAWAFSLVLAASNLMCFFCAGPVAQLSDRFGRKAALIPGMLLVGLAPLLLAAVPQLLQNATTSLLKPLILSLSVGSLALGMGLVGGALPTIFTDGVPSRLHVESLSFLRASTELGSVLLTLTMSSMVGSIGFTWPLLGGGLCALYAAARFALKYRL
eukprot:g16726.t1